MLSRKKKEGGEKDQLPKISFTLIIDYLAHSQWGIQESHTDLKKK